MEGRAMRGSRSVVLVRLAAVATIVAFGLSTASEPGGLAPVGAASTPASGAAVQPVPFAAGHILVAGKMSQPPTTADCETDFGIACYQAFQLQQAYDLAPLFAKGI